MQNGRVESFNGKLRNEFLNISWFRNLLEARKQAAAFRREYKESSWLTTPGELVTAASYAQVSFAAVTPEPLYTVRAVGSPTKLAVKYAESVL